MISMCIQWSLYVYNDLYVCTMISMCKQWSLCVYNDLYGCYQQEMILTTSSSLMGMFVESETSLVRFCFRDG